MAGSYRHVTNADGTFRGFGLVENRKDCIEAIEEMWLMIDWLTGGNKQKIFEAWRNGYFARKCPAENARLATFERFWYEDEE
ncbi:hypothetical protein [Burkholderia territorii]|uniref:hypothetical protein n=1 Tax=Burkholderia territorii TaxID=1503055 RepID=UPI000B1F762A|nr:hypothetical protein [Burkholderia territorii]